MNQEQLKEDYRYQLLNGGPKNFVRPVRRIVCEGCAKIFYTEVPTKKYCSERCCYLGFWIHKREKRLGKRKDGLKRYRSADRNIDYSFEFEIESADETP